MTEMTFPGMPAALIGPPATRRKSTGQWKLHRFQVVNWGGFEGHHDLEIDELGTLLSGGSGTGKSTLLDAFIALVQDSHVAFNGASNNSGTGRARSAEQRNLLSYVRGELDVSRDDDSSTRQNLLRGNKQATWSAIAATFRHTDGTEYTLLRTMFAPASATHANDIRSRLIQTPGSLSLKQLEGHAAGGFDKRQLRQAFPDFTFFNSHGDFAATFHQRLNIGRDGDGGPAMRMLARIQASETITSVDSLFKHTVLERPRTYEAAERAVTSFASLVTIHDEMQTAEAQIALLRPSVDLAKRLDTALDELALLDTFRLADPTRPGPVTLWSAQLRKSLLESEALTAKTNAADAGRQQSEALKEVRSLEGQLKANEQSQKDNGGDALAALENEIATATAHLADVEAKRTEYTAAAVVPTGGALALPDTEAGFTQLRGNAEKTIGEYEQVKAELAAERDQLRDQRFPLHQRSQALRDEIVYFQGRRNLVPQFLDEARVAIARHVGVEVDTLVFVAELLDLRPEHENWRQAAELLLGGFAKTLLVDQRHRSFRRTLESLKLSKRINFELVDVNAVPVDLDPATLPGRLAIDETSPFTGWLSGELARNWSYECLETSEFPDDNRRRITITGQVQNGRRGSHGGHGQARILGFSTADRVAELTAEKDRVEAELDRLERSRQDIDGRALRSEKVKEASVHLLGLSWTQLDAEAAAGTLGSAKSRLAALTKANDKLAELKEQAVGLEEDLDTWRATEIRQRDRNRAEQQRWEALVDSEDRTSDEIERLEAADIVVTSEQKERLDTEYLDRAKDGSSEELDGVLVQMTRELTRQAGRTTTEINTVSGGLKTIFDSFQSQWKQDNLGTQPESYPGFKAILDRLEAEGLAERRAEFTKRVIDWSSEDLLDLSGAFEESIDEIRNRLDPVNDVLSGLAYGAGRDQLQIQLRVQRDADVTTFRQQLTRLASSTTRITADDVDERFAQVGEFIARFDATPGNGRDQLLDVRRHVHIEAENIDRATGAVLACYDSLGNKSGGETQELVAFILGAALRYRLGITDGGEPGYATVVLDEGFIKADAEFAGRALTAWQGLGFQLLVGAPMDKLSAIEPYVNKIVSITKRDGRSYTHTFDSAQRATRPDLTAGPALRVVTQPAGPDTITEAAARNAGDPAELAGHLG